MRGNVLFETGCRVGCVRRREFFNPSRHLFRVHPSDLAGVVSLLIVRMLGAVVGDGKKSCARRVCRRRDCRRSRRDPGNIRKPYAQATVSVVHTNSMRGGSYYCRELSSSVVAARFCGK